MKHDTTLGLLCHLGIIFATFRVSLGQSCTFQSGLCDWISVGSGPRWRSSLDPNTSSSAEELTSYAYVTISQNTDNDTAAILQSPEVNAATTDTIEIGFQYQLSDHSQGDLPNTLSVRWSINEEDFNDVWHTNGPTNSWVTTSLVLAQGGVSRFAFLAKSTVPSQDAFVMIRNVEITIIHDSCASSPCNNGGLCFGNGPTFTCICTGGYRGEVCQILPGDTLSRFFRGRNSYRSTTTAHHRNIDHITSTPTIKGTPQFIDTATDFPTSYDSTSLISEQTTKFKGQETRGMGTMTRRSATNPTPTQSTTDSTPSPCFRRSPVPSVTAATTSVSGATNEMTNAGTSNTMNTGTDVTSGSKLTTQLETQQSTEQTPSTLSRSTIESLTLVTSGIPERTTNSLSLTTATHPMTFPTALPTTSPTTMTTYFDDLPTTATDVVSDISFTDETGATQGLISVETDVPSSEDYSTLSDVLTSFKSTESDQTTQQTDPISSTTEGTISEVSSRATTKQFVTQSVTTTEEIATVTGVVSPSTHDIITSAVIGLSTEEITTRPDTPPGADPMTSETNGIVTQRSTTRLGDDGTNTGYMSTMDTGMDTTKSITTETAASSTSTGESITDLETPVYSISTGIVSSAVTENYDLDTSQALTTRTATLSTESTKFKPSSTDESTETSYASTVEMVTDRTLTDIPTTGIGVASSSSSSSTTTTKTTITSISVSSLSQTSNSPTTTLEVPSDVSQSTIAATLNSNLTRSTGNSTSPVTSAISSSQSSLNSTSASVSGGGGAVNVPLAVGLSVTGVVGTVAVGVTILIVRRARRVSYGLTES
ncbi:mucin-5AC-like isoform X2 [Lytechinus variegatus]|uniref:mucin-5AC-like isoform X2 n=1 Tax=Lytechinus variegatus TaxID=7654 RepID=UPI001BB0E98D|nr:mucin-5AC-like isoform X2 [Lytechinus variegatus]